MRLKRNLMLAVLLAASAIVAYRYDYQPRVQSEIAERDGMRLFLFDPGKVKRVRVESGKESYEVERRDGKWFLTSPMKARASDFAVNEILQTAAVQEAEKKFDGGEPLEYGLDPADRRLDFYLDGNASPFTLWLGDHSPTGSGSYIRTTKLDGIYLAGGNFSEKISKNLFEIREKRLVDGYFFEIRKVAIEKRGKRLVLEKDEKGSWHMLEPVKADALKPPTEEMLRKMAGLSVYTFVDESLKDEETGFSRPTAKIQLWRNGETRPQTLIFGKSDKDRGGTWIKTAEYRHAGLAPPDILREVPDDPGEFLEKKYFGVTPSEIKGIRFEADGKTPVEITKEEDAGWKISHPLARPVDAKKLNAMMEKLLSEEWTALIDPEVAKFIPPEKVKVLLKVELALEKEWRSVSYYDIKVGNEGYAVTSNYLPYPFIVASATVKNLMKEIENNTMPDLEETAGDKKT